MTVNATTNTAITGRDSNRRSAAKHSELTSALRDMVATLRPGDRLPTQEELMRRFRVSDTTVLRSLDTLKREGRIVRRQGSGTFVADRTPRPVEKPVQARGMVAVLTRPSASPFFAEMIQAVENNLGGYDMAPVLILDTALDRRIQRVMDHWSRGEIIGAIHIGSVRLEGMEGLPTVLIGETVQEQDYCQISLDNFAAGERVGEYLWSLGHRHVAVITIQKAVGRDVIPPQGVDRLRVAGIRSIWERSQGAWREDWQIAHPILLTPGDGRAVRVMRSYLEPLFSTSAPYPTAIFAAHDEMAAVAIRALEEMGLNVPEDVSVVGFNDSGTLAAYFRPSLTTVRTPCPALGTLAVHLLLDLLNHPDRKPRSVRLPPEITVRESTASPRLPTADF